MQTITSLNQKASGKASRYHIMQGEVENLCKLKYGMSINECRIMREIEGENGYRLQIMGRMRHQREVFWV